MSTRRWSLWAVAFISLTGTFASAEHEDDALVERGRVAYVDHYCGACHRLDAIGSVDIFGPAHDDAARAAQERVEDYASYEFEATHLAREARFRSGGVDELLLLEALKLRAANLDDG